VRVAAVVACRAEDGDLYSWTVSSINPVALLTGRRLTSVVAGAGELAFWLALTESGDVYAHGADKHGVLGLQPEKDATTRSTAAAASAATAAAAGDASSRSVSFGANTTAGTSATPAASGARRKGREEKTDEPQLIPAYGPHTRARQRRFRLLSVLSAADLSSALRFALRVNAQIAGS
jgi:hypothetical protein